MSTSYLSFDFIFIIPFEEKNLIVEVGKLY